VRIDSEGEELVDAGEAALRLGFKSARTVLDLRMHHLGFPAPVGRMGRSLLWSWSQIERWDADGAGPRPRERVAG